MELSNYKKEALRSEQPLQAVIGDDLLIPAVLRTAAKMAAVIDLVKKTVVYGRAQDARAMVVALQETADWAMHARRLAETGPVEPKPIPVNPRLLHAALGHYGEAGESFEALLAQLETGTLDIENVAEEAGDKLWYTALELDEIEKLTGWTPTAVCRANIGKLQVRFPDKFSLAASEARDTNAEKLAMRDQRLDYADNDD